MFGRKDKDGGKLAKTRNWYADRYQTAVIFRNLLFLIAIVALLVAAATIYAQGQLVASKTFEPYVIQVEEKTGIATVVPEGSVREFTGREAVKRHFIWRYIRAREGYNFATYEYNYEQVVRLMSSREVFRGFVSSIQEEGPNSPTTLGRSSELVAELKSLSFLDRGGQQAQVRFVVRRMIGPQLKSERHLIAVVTFAFDANLPLNYQERIINPLGFQVIDYELSEETA